MRYLFKNCFLLLLGSLFIRCLNSGLEPEPPFIDEEKQNQIRLFATENGYPETIPIDNFVEYLYKKWPYENEKKDYILTFPKQDTIPRILFLSDILTKIGKPLRVHYSENGTIFPAYIDSICIKTDSVIILPALDLEDCHLFKLPAEIGKIRTQKLDISWNKGLTLPNEIIYMDSLPQPYDTLDVDTDQTWTSETFDLLPEWAKDWLGEHNF